MSHDVKPLPATGRVLLEEVLQIADEGVVIHDAAGNIVYGNLAAERILGLSAQDFLGSDIHTFEQATIREDGSAFPVEEHPVMLTLRTGKRCSDVVMGVRWNSSSACRWISINSGVIPPSAGEPLMAFAIFSDITPHVESKRQLREMAMSLQQANRALSTAESLIRNVLQAIPDHVWLKDLEGVYLFCNSALARSYNSTTTEVIGKTDYDFSPPEQADLFRQQDREVALSDKPLVIEESVSFLATPFRPSFETVKVALRDEAGQLVGILGISRDITERRMLQEQLRQSNNELRKLTDELRSLVRTDPLTALFNRRAFEETIGWHFQQFRRVGTISSLLMIDIDHFKQVNDRYGHDAGDAALHRVAETFRANCRPEDMAARLGGEEFAVLLPSNSAKDATRIAERLREEIEKTEVKFGLKRFSLTVSIGVSSFRHPDSGWPEIVSRADAALYAAKGSGRNKVVRLLMSQ